jgi:hypothetical protein
MLGVSLILDPYAPIDWQAWSSVKIKRMFGRFVWVVSCADSDVAQRNTHKPNPINTVRIVRIPSEGSFSLCRNHFVAFQSFARQAGSNFGNAKYYSQRGR